MINGDKGRLTSKNAFRDLITNPFDPIPLHPKTAFLLKLPLLFSRIYNSACGGSFEDPLFGHLEKGALLFDRDAGDIKMEEGGKVAWPMYVDPLKANIKRGERRAGW